jgi:hypothetical protein
VASVFVVPGVAAVICVRSVASVRSMGFTLSMVLVRVVPAMRMMAVRSRAMRM